MAGAEQAEATRGAGPALHCGSHSAGCGSGQAAVVVSLLQPAPPPSVSSVVGRPRRPEGLISACEGAAPGPILPLLLRLRDSLPLQGRHSPRLQSSRPPAA